MIVHKLSVLDSALNICYAGSVTGFLTHILHGLDSQSFFFLCKLTKYFPKPQNIFRKVRVKQSGVKQCFLKVMCKFQFLNSLTKLWKFRRLCTDTWVLDWITLYQAKWDSIKHIEKVNGIIDGNAVSKNWQKFHYYCQDRVRAGPTGCHALNKNNDGSPRWWWAIQIDGVCLNQVRIWANWLLLNHLQDCWKKKNNLVSVIPQ